MRKLTREMWFLQLPKNAFQYLVGFSFYLTTFGEFNILKLIIGLSSFLLTYSSIYYYNDLMDYKEDKKKKVKRAYKALARGEITHNTAVTRMARLMLSGLVLGSLIGGWYVLLLLGLLITNHLHSSPNTKKKFKYNMKYLYPNLFIMQFLKFAGGWFTFTTNLTMFPTFIITCLSSAFVFGYIMYKESVLKPSQVFKKKSKSLIILSIITLTTFFISLIIYPFKIPLLALIPTMFLFFTMRKQKNEVIKTMGFLRVITVVILSIIISTLLLNVPVIEDINEGAGRLIDTLGTLSIERLDNNSLNLLIEINNTLYSYQIKDLNELDAILNFSKADISIRNYTEE